MAGACVGAIAVLIVRAAANRAANTSAGIGDVS